MVTFQEYPHMNLMCSLSYSDEEEKANNHWLSTYQVQGMIVMMMMMMMNNNNEHLLGQALSDRCFTWITSFYPQGL